MVDNDEPLQVLFRKMDKDLREDPTGPNVKQYMEEYFNSGSQDWKSYVSTVTLPLCLGSTK